MSRKARIDENEKKEWNCVRCWTASKGFRHYKPTKGVIVNPLIIFEDKTSSSMNPLSSIAGVAQYILFEQENQNPSLNEEFSLVIIIDFTSLVEGYKTDVLMKEIEEE